MTEELPYEVVGHLGDGVELRRYPSYAVAEVTIRGSLGGAGNVAFAPLFAYIRGENRGRASVAMTAPVMQERARGGPGAGQAGGRQVAMTAPVVQQESGRDGTGSSFTVGFVLPSSLTAQTAPEPTDQRVSLRAVPPSLTAAIRYSGRWSGSAFEMHRDRLLRSVEEAGLAVVGAPRWLRYDPPFKPWFLRRNEVVVDLADPDAVPPAA
ncbi:heme-binding protein [Phycicoccus ginsengisoli]